MSVLTDSQLETDTYEVLNWEKIYNANIDRLDDTLLKINGLIDVTLEGSIKDGSILVWQASNSKWRPQRFQEG